MFGKKSTPPPRRNRGFTLIEMLTVTAITAVLVATSIPVVGGSLERAREATDTANERAAIAEATIEYLNGNISTISSSAYGVDPLIYDVIDGKLHDIKIEKDYNWPSYGKCEKHKNGCIYVLVGDDGLVKLGWYNENFQPTELHLVERYQPL